jgi:hypothetical protein
MDAAQNADPVCVHAVMMYKSITGRIAEGNHVAGDPRIESSCSLPFLDEILLPHISSDALSRSIALQLLAFDNGTAGSIVALCCCPHGGNL